MVLYQIIAQRELAVCDDKVFCLSSGDFQGIGFYHQSEGCWGQRKKALLARPYIVSIKTARLSLGVVRDRIAVSVSRRQDHCRRVCVRRSFSVSRYAEETTESRNEERTRRRLACNGGGEVASRAVVHTGCLPGCVISASIMPLSGMCAVGRLQPSGQNALRWKRMLFRGVREASVYDEFKLPVRDALQYPFALPTQTRSQST
jgi:hypothetical protein